MSVISSMFDVYGELVNKYYVYNNTSDKSVISEYKEIHLDSKREYDLLYGLFIVCFRFVTIRYNGSMLGYVDMTVGLCEIRSRAIDKILL